MFSQLFPYFISIVIGLLIGIEREKAHPIRNSMGVRTFLLICLLGSIAGGLQNIWLSAIVALFSLTLIVISYFSQRNTSGSNFDRGLTTEFAGGIVFCLGYSTHHSPLLAAVIGPVVALVLFSKATLHRFTKAIRPIELEAALLLFLIGVVVINLVPNTTIDPWGVFNPQKFGYLILTLATLEFSSYFVTKVIGAKKGAILIGFLGGIVSSTAVLLSAARQATKSPENWRSLLTAAVLTWILM